jgi:CelD/BcsL family acetyltransferase involved in cellulose biosynthesis
MRIDLVTDLGRLARDWDDLAGELAAPPFLRPGWLELWWAAFGRGELVALTARDSGGRLRGVLPLVRRRHTLAAPANDHTPWFGVVAHPDATDGLASALGDRGEPRVLLTHLDAETHRAVNESGRLVASRGTIDSPRVDIDGTWTAYESSLGAGLRSDLRRRWRRVHEAGVVELDLDAPLTALEDGLQIEGSGWKDAAGTAIRSRPDTLAFYRGLAEWAAGRGLLRLCLLRIDGRPAAFHFNLLEHGVVYHLKGGFDPSFERLSPGRVLHHAALRAAWERGDRRYEFLGSPDRYKLQFANARTTVRHVELFPRTVAGVLGYAACAWGRPVAKRALLSARAAGAQAARRRARSS